MKNNTESSGAGQFSEQVYKFFDSQSAWAWGIAAMYPMGNPRARLAPPIESALSGESHV
jgi:hypothetical protein